MITVGKAAKISGLSKNRVRLLCDLGIVKSFRHHGNRVINEQSLMDFLDRLWSGKVDLPDYPYVIKRRKEKEKLKKAKDQGDLEDLRDWSVPE